MNAKRILFVDLNTDGTTGGSHFCLLDIISRLDRSRYEPIAHFSEENAIIGEFRSRCATFVVPPRRPADHRLDRSDGGTALRGLALGLRRGTTAVRSVIPSVAAKARFLAAHRIALVHLNNSVNRGYDWLVAAKALRIPCITHSRGRFDLTRAQRFFARRFDAVISIARFLDEELRRQGVGGGPIAVVINDGIDPDDIAARRRAPSESVRRSLGVGQHDPLIGIVGNVRRWKGQDVAVRAVALLVPEFPALRCVVVGERSPRRGDDAAYLRSIEALIAEYGLERAVTLLGYRSDAIDIVGALDLFVHASTEPEPFGRVILEAMALGRPVVASAAGGPLEIIEHGVTGMLVAPGDARALAGAIRTLLGDEGKRSDIARAGRELVAARYSLTRHMEELHALYERLLGG